MKSLGFIAAVPAVILTSALVVGCTEADATPDAAHSGAATAVENGSAPADVAGQDITVQVADRAAYDELIASHQGKVVLADFWATWCGPCVEQFPHTVELSKKYDPAELAVVSVSMDEPSDQEKVLAFLREHGAAFDNLLGEYGVGEKGVEAFEITDGAVPHYKVYDRSGTLVHTANSNEELDRLIAQLLTEE
jgi:thiol-disulfide isomerase/thioredoxin